MEEKIAQLEALFKEGKKDEAKALIREIIGAKVSKDDQGEILVGFAEIYLDVMNRINADYRDALAKTIKELEELDVLDAKLDDESKTGDVRERLGMN